MVARDRHADRTKDGRDWDTYERGGGRDRDTKQQGRAVSPLRRQSARDEERERERERNRESGLLRGGDAGGYLRDDKGRKDQALDPTKDGRYLRKSEREGFERQKAEKDATLEDRGRGKESTSQDQSRDRDANMRHRHCYGDSRGTEKLRVPQRRNIDINKHIMGAQGASKLCSLIEATVAEFNHVVTAPHTCLSCEHTNMTF